MLILQRQRDQRIVIEGTETIVLTVVEVRGKFVRLGFEGPAHVRILREELATAEQDPSCPPPSTLHPAPAQ